jgi:cyclophilin family peptidyl-prolyl cis-trans isomerase
MLAMKKYLMPLFAVSLLVSGCGTKPAVVTRPEIDADTEAPQVVKSNDLPQSTAVAAKNRTKISDSIELEDLAAEYDTVLMTTNYGQIKLKLYADESPLTVNNFLNLAKEGFYDKTKFHRVMDGFMIQGGDPNSRDDDWSDDGRGGPDYRFPDEFNGRKLVRGSLAMANAGPGTNGSQFFIVTADATPWLDGKHTNFGEVLSGMDVVDKISITKVNPASHPLEDVVIEKVELVKK